MLVEQPPTSPPDDQGAGERVTDFFMQVSRNGTTTYEGKAIGPTGENTNTHMPHPPTLYQAMYRNLVATHSFVSRVKGLAEKFYNDLEIPHQEPQQELGSAVLDYLIRDDPNLRSRWEESLRAKKPGQTLRLRLIVPPELEEFPWELAHDRKQGKFLCRHPEMSLVRDTELGPISVEPIKPPINLLAAIANPNADARLDVAGELKALKDLESNYPGWITIHPLEQASRRELQECLEQDQRDKEPIRYHAVHFIGHSDYDPDIGSFIWLFDETKRAPELMRADEFTALLGSYSPLQVVTFNSCRSSRIAAQLARMNIPAVLAWSGNVWDDTCTTFTSHFYGGLLEGKLIDTAIWEGRRAIRGIAWSQLIAYLRCHEIRLEQGADPVPSPTDAAGWRQEARRLFRAGDYEEALKAYQQAITCNPHFVEAHHGIIDCLLKSGNVAEAERHLKWLEQQPWNR